VIVHGAESFGAHLLRESEPLEASVASLDVSPHGVIVSVLQEPQTHLKYPERPIVHPGSIWLHDATTFRADRLAAVAGSISRPRFSDDGTRIVVHSWPDFRRVADVLVWHVARREQLASRRFTDEPFAWTAAFLGDRVVCGMFDRPWRRLEPYKQQEPMGSKLIVLTEDLRVQVGQLDADDAGFIVCTRGNMVAATGIDLHVWWPGSDRPPFSMFASVNAHVGAEVGPCSVSRLGSRVAVCAGPMGQPDAYVLDTADLDRTPVGMRGDTFPRGEGSGTRETSS
jgi:hypothetical protein